MYCMTLVCGGKKNSIIVVLSPCWAKRNVEITERWILILEGSIVLKLQVN